jgi:hypothetical protein
MSHRSFAITRGLNRYPSPMHLYEKAKGTSLDEINRVARETGNS